MYAISTHEAPLRRLKLLTVLYDLGNWHHLRPGLFRKREREWEISRRFCRIASSSSPTLPIESQFVANLRFMSGRLVTHKFERRRRSFEVTSVWGCFRGWWALGFCLTIRDQSSLRICLNPSVIWFRSSKSNILSITTSNTWQTRRPTFLRQEMRARAPTNRLLYLL